MRFVRGFFRWIWNILRVSHMLVFGTLSLFILVLLLISLFSDNRVRVPSHAALEINFNGAIVEQRTRIDPIEVLLAAENMPREMLLRDILAGLKRAGDDDNIQLVVLRLNGLLGAGPAILHRVGEALDQLRASGKTVLAYGDYYTQAQYLLAAHADEVYLNPAGLVEITGYGIYPLYYQAALEKLKIEMNVFRVGTFKSAVEPYIRNDMSEAAKEATGDFLNVLWGHYLSNIEATRAAKGADVHLDFTDLGQRLRAAGGDTAKLAQQLGLVDGLKSRDEFDDIVAARLGHKDDAEPYAAIDLKDYLEAGHVVPKLSTGPKVALIYAVGEILDGEQPDGRIGGDTLSGLIRQAREDDDVKAIVLRVDSPGGSAFASEIIRRELTRAQAEGKPVVISMGSVAASGGYWISATADEIWAQPTTITGSIGIFGILPNFNKSLDALGVHSDGVGTTALSGQFSLTRPLGDNAKDIMQQTIENGYAKFINLVAQGRRMAPEDVDKIAQGRVWSGDDALRLGLVDQLGNLGDAIAAAAQRAQLEKYNVHILQTPMSTEERLLRQVIDNAAVRAALHGRASGSADLSLLARLKKDLMLPLKLNDPQGAYAICFECRLGGARP